MKMKTWKLWWLAAWVSAAAMVSGTEKQVFAEEKEVVSILLTEEIKNSGYWEVLNEAAQLAGTELKAEYLTSDEVGGDVIRGKLAAGEMEDICVFNSGSLLKSLYPDEYFLDLSDQEFVKDMEPVFRNAVTVDRAVYGVPSSYYCSAGVVLYNRTLYQEYGLSVPKTWGQFLDNCEAIQENGKIAVIGGFAQEWQSQVCFLADYYNVQKEIPDFPGRFAEGKVKFSQDPIAFRGWEKSADLAALYNDDIFSTNNKKACDMLIKGDGAHYITMSGEALGYIAGKYGEQADIGAFAIPGDREEIQGITLWPSSAFYINKNGKHQEAALRIMKILMSRDFVEKCLQNIPPAGPLTVKNVKFPEDTMQAVKDIQAYIDRGAYCIALEYQAVFKGPDCEYYTGKVAAGQMTAMEAALAYDQSCEKQALLEGLDWKS